jgi:hypothetical protein
MTTSTTWVRFIKDPESHKWNTTCSHDGYNNSDPDLKKIAKELIKAIEKSVKGRDVEEIKIDFPKNKDFRVELKYFADGTLIKNIKFEKDFDDKTKTYAAEFFSKIPQPSSQETGNGVVLSGFQYREGAAIDVAGTSLRTITGSDKCYNKTSGKIYEMKDGARSGQVIGFLWKVFGPPVGSNPDDLFRESLNAKTDSPKFTEFNWNNRSIGGLNFSGKNLSNTSSGSSSANSPINDNTHIIQRRAPFRQGFESHSLNSSETNLPGSSATNPGSPLNISTRIKRKDASNSLNSSGTNLPNSSASSPATPLNISPRTTSNDLSISDFEINDEVGESKENLKASTSNRTKFIWKSPTVRSLHTSETNLPNSSANNPGSPLSPLNNSPRNNIPNTQGKDAFRPGSEINAEIDENKENLEAST